MIKNIFKQKICGNILYWVVKHFIVRIHETTNQFQREYYLWTIYIRNISKINMGDRVSWHGCGFQNEMVWMRLKILLDRRSNSLCCQFYIKVHFKHYKIRNLNECFEEMSLVTERTFIYTDKYHWEIDVLVFDFLKNGPYKNLKIAQFAK